MQLAGQTVTVSFVASWFFRHGLCERGLRDSFLKPVALSATAWSTGSHLGTAGWFQTGPPRIALYFLTEHANFPFHAEPAQFEEPAGRLPAADVHDARRRHCYGEPDQRLARAGAGRTVIEVEWQAVEEGHRLRAAAGGASALAHRCFLYQHQRDVLLAVQHSRRLQPLHRQLGTAGVND